VDEEVYKLGCRSYFCTALFQALVAFCEFDDYKLKLLRGKSLFLRKLIDQAQEFLKEVIHLADLPNHRVQRVPKFMADSGIDKSEEILFRLDFFVEHPV